MSHNNLIELILPKIHIKIIDSDFMSNVILLLCCLVICTELIISIISGECFKLLLLRHKVDSSSVTTDFLSVTVVSKSTENLVGIIFDRYFSSELINFD